MGMLDELLNAQGGGALAALARQFGVSEDEARKALGGLAPALSAGMKQRLADPSAAGGLMDALQQGRFQEVVEKTEAVARPETVDAGNELLGQLFGSKDVSREVAQRAAGQTGLDSGLLKRMLPVVAAMAMGAAGKRVGSTGGAGREGLLGQLSSFLDADQDGSVVDDLMGMAKKLF